jgi:DNA-binding NarL/FixJ family response regulator
MPLGKSKLSVVIVDEHYLQSVALEAIIDKYEYLQVIAKYNSCNDLVKEIDKVQPHVIFIDELGNHSDCQAAIQTIIARFPLIRIVVLGISDEGDKVKKMMDAGVWAFITNRCCKEEYDELFKRILEDKKYISSKPAINYSLYMQDQMNLRKQTKQVSTFNMANPSLTRREKEIVYYIAQGLSDKQTAEALKVSPRTIDAHKQNIMNKFGTRKSTEIVAIAYKLKII